jgi:hypothetical protein
VERKKRKGRKKPLFHGKMSSWVLFLISAALVWSVSASHHRTKQCTAFLSSFSTRQRCNWEYSATLVPPPYTTTTTTSLWFQKAEITVDKDLLQAHELVVSKDPQWYQEYVVNLLGPDFVSSTFEPQTPTTPPSSLSDGNKEVEDSEEQVAPSQKETPLLLDEIEKPPSLKMEEDDKLTEPAVSVAENLSGSNDEKVKPREENKVETNAVELEEKENESAVLDIAANENFDDGATLPFTPSPQSNDKSMDIPVASTPPEKKPLVSTGNSKEKPDASVIPTTSSTSRPTTSPPAFLDDRVVIFQDLGQKLQSIPLANLTSWGYRIDEIEALQSDALAVIVNDEVQRPRSGVPPQWKNSPEVRDELAVRMRVRVMDADQAEQVLQEEASERQRRRNVESDSTVRRRSPSSSDVGVRTNQQGMPRREATGGRQDVDTGSTRSKPRSQVDESRREARMRNPDSQKDSMEKTRFEDTDDIENFRRSQSRAPSDTTAPRKIRTSPDGTVPPRRRGQDEEVSPRRQRRTSVERNGSPKRIYNGRELDGRRKSPGQRRDPPPPNSPLWMDMDTFRDLLRNEAEFRVRILGDDWADTVKQESEWRLELYKNWLWALHNGVGGSVAPPSRYERARRTADRREMEDGPPRRRKKNRSPPPE